jgi:glyoxylase-like metal-dependent hydrolase (beta-lactamase superfamily II)
MKSQSKKEHPIYTIDLKFGGRSSLIAAYLVIHDQGAILVETGPGSTLLALEAGLRSHGISVHNVTDVLVTHIHLDHAGASGWLARQGARIHVHANGAPHLANPEKLLSSAARIYGDAMQTLWGEFLPVPEDRIVVAEDGETIQIHGLEFRPLDTPGHATHHIAYIFQDVCFTGDIGGVRMAGTHYLRLPMPPPEFNLELKAVIEGIQSRRVQKDRTDPFRNIRRRGLASFRPGADTGRSREMDIAGDAFRSNHR